MDPLDSPQLFDILGVVAFLYIIALSLWGLYHDRLMPRMLLQILLLIGLLGLIVDSAIVYHFFVR